MLIKSRILKSTFTREVAPFFVYVPKCNFNTWCIRWAFITCTYFRLITLLIFIKWQKKYGMSESLGNLYHLTIPCVTTSFVFVISRHHISFFSFCGVLSCMLFCLKMEFRSCTWWRRWYSIFCYHWWTALTQPKLLNP